MSKRHKQDAPSNGVAPTNGVPGPASAPAAGRPVPAPANPAPVPNPKPLPSGTELADLIFDVVEGGVPSPAASRSGHDEPGPGRSGEHEAPVSEAEIQDDGSLTIDPIELDAESPAELPPDLAEADLATEPAQAPDQDAAAQDGPAAGDEDEDLSRLAGMDDDELEAHGRANQWAGSYLKRVKKFTRQQRSLEAKIRRLEDQAAEREDRPEPEARPAAPVAYRPEAPSRREAELSTEMASHEDWLDRIDSVSPGDSLQVGEQTFGPEQLRKARRKLEAQLGALTYERNAAQRERTELIQAGEAEAITRHPWLKDRSHPDTAAIQNALHEYPVLKSVPHVRTLLADALTLRRLQAQANATKRPGAGVPALAGPNRQIQNGSAPAKVASPAARPPGRPAAAPLPMRRQGPDTAAGVKKALATGSHADAAAVVLDLIDK